MNAEQYLQSIRNAKARIHELEKLKEEINMNIITIKAMNVTGDRVQSSPKKDGLELQAIKAIEKMESIDKRIIKEREKYIIKKNNAINKILKMKEGQCRRFLIDYYINCKSEIQIAQEYRYNSIDSLRSLKKRSIKYFEKIDKKVLTYGAPYDNI